MSRFAGGPADDEIDFVDAVVDGGADEDLHQPPVRDLPGTPFLRRLLLVVAVVAILAVVAVHGIVDRAARPQARRAATVAASSAPVAPPVHVTLGVTDGRVIHAPDPNTHRNDVEEVVVAGADVTPACPMADDGQSACVTVTRVPGPVLAAVRAQFGTARVTKVTSQELRDTGPNSTPGLFSRTVVAHQGPVTISVGIREGAQPDPNAGSATKRAVEIFAQHQEGDLLVEVEISAPGGWSLSNARADRLAADPGLLALD